MEDRKQKICTNPKGGNLKGSDVYLFKKFITLGVSLMLFFTAFSIPIKGETAALTGNLIADGGFEENAENWVWASSSIRSTEKARSGTYAAKLVYPGSGNARVVQDFVGNNLTSGATYELRFWMWTTSEKATPKVRFTYTGGTVPFEEPAFTPESGQWTEGVYTFTPTAGVVKVNISFRLYGGGTLYFDDISLIKIKSGNLFKNADFEDTESTAWIKVNGATYSDAVAKSGTYSIKLDKQDSRVTQSLYAANGIVQGAKYELRVFTYHASGSVRPRIKLQCGGTDKEDSFDLSYKANTWTENKITFQVPLGTTRLDVLLRLYGDGVLYYDDASLEMTEPPERVICSTNEVFYYTDLTTGYVYLDVNKAAYPSYANYAADLIIKDEKGTALFTKNGESLASGSATVPFDLTKLAITEKPYTVKCKIRDGTILMEEKEIEIYRRYERPEYLTKEGTFEIGGKPFYPVFGYHINHKKYEQVFDAESGETLLDIVKAHGVNVVQLPAGLILPANLETLVLRLDTLWKYGLYGFVCLYPNEYAAGSETILPNDTRSTADYVRNMLKYTYTQNGVTKRLIDHPAIFAWGVADEPLSGGLPVEDLFKSVILLRDADDVHPLYDTENGTGFYEESIKYVDILGMDDYSYSQSRSLSHIIESTAAGEDFAEESGKATATILQYFNRNQDGSVPDKDYFPSPDEMRNMIYQSFFAGAPSFGYYAFDSVQDGKYVMFTETGKAIEEFAKEEQELMFKLFTSGEYTRADEGETADGQYVLLKGNGKTYLALRSKAINKTVTLSVPVEKTCFLQKTFGIEAESVTAGYENISVTLPPSGTALLELREANDIEFLKNGQPILSGSPGEPLTVTYFGKEENVQIFVALYAHENTGKEVIDIQFFAEGGGTYKVPDRAKTAYSLWALAWKNGKIVPISTPAKITVK